MGHEDYDKVYSLEKNVSQFFKEKQDEDNTSKMLANLISLCDRTARLTTLNTDPRMQMTREV